MTALSSLSAKRRRKLARTFVGVSLLVVIGAGFSAQGNAADVSESKHSGAAGYVTVVVAPGETLWSIAGMVGGDSASVVDQIVELNHLDGIDVVAGQKLVVPAK
jgi:LysM repeat protein